MKKELGGKTLGSSSINRKDFLKLTSLSVFGLGLISSGNPFLRNSDTIKNSNQEKKINLRTITYNVFNGCIGYVGINGRALTQNARSTLVSLARDQGQIPKRMVLELALYKPDIINFTESPGEDIVAEMAEMLNFNYTFFPGSRDGKGGFPGSILTSLEIISSQNRPFVDDSNPEELFTRHWGKALLRLPDNKTVSVHTAHLWPFKKEENDTRIRMNEIDALLASIKNDLDNNAGSVLLQGDLNHSPDMPEYKHLNTGLLKDAFAEAGTENGFGYTYDSIHPAKRIDFIYAGGELSNNIKNCEVLNQGSFRMDINDPKGFALSDHLPVMADFELK